MWVRVNSLDAWCRQGEGDGKGDGEDKHEVSVRSRVGSSVLSLAGG